MLRYHSNPDMSAAIKPFAFQRQTLISGVDTLSAAAYGSSMQTVPRFRET